MYRVHRIFHDNISLYARLLLYIGTGYAVLFILIKQKLTAVETGYELLLDFLYFLDDLYYDRASPST